MKLKPVGAHDVINAGIIRQAILARSLARGDHPDVRRWLETHFFRWVISSFEHTLPVKDIRAWRVCGGSEPIPIWLQEKLAAGNRDMLYIDAEHTSLLAQESKMVEFLQSRLQTQLAGRFQRISFAAADNGWRKDHERMYRKRKRGWWPSQPQALVEIITTASGRFVELRGSGHLLRAELAYESYHMQHCLGQFTNWSQLHGGYGEHYARACEDGRIRLFSLRDANNHPHVTLSLEDDFGEWSVDQIKGKQNTVPAARYVPAVLQLLNYLRPRPNGCEDLWSLGIVARKLPTALGRSLGFNYQPFSGVTSTNLRYDLVATYPHLIAFDSAPDRAAQWLALGAGGNVSAFGANPEAAISAAQALTVRNETVALNDIDPVEVFTRHFPDRQNLLPTPDQFIRTREQRGWLSHLLTSSNSPPYSRQFNPVYKWALAISEPLFHRHAITGVDYRLSLNAPSFIPQRQRDLIRDELGLGSCRDVEAVSEFVRNFFYVPEFAQIDGINDAGSGSARQYLAAHAMRQSYILRQLVTWKLIEEPLGWALLLLNAQRVRDCFADWEEFGDAAAQGRSKRTLWMSRDSYQLQGSSPNKTAEVEWLNFNQSIDCLWRQIEWSSFDLRADDYM